MSLRITAAPPSPPPPLSHRSSLAEAEAAIALSLTLCVCSQVIERVWGSAPIVAYELHAMLPVNSRSVFFGVCQSLAIAVFIFGALSEEQLRYLHKLTRVARKVL